MRHVLARLILASPLLVILLAPWPTQSVANEVAPAMVPLDLGGLSVAGAIAKGNPKLESTLDQLVQAYRTGGLSNATEFAADHGGQISGNSVLVIAQAQADQAEELATAAISLGVSVEKTYGNLVQLRCSIALLEAVANLPSAQFVRQPATLSTTSGQVTTNGVLTTGAFKWHQAGITGRGIKVAVLDLGFDGYDLLLGSDLPSADKVIARSFRLDEDIRAGDSHGTAVAEIVYDMVPDATLYLVNVQTEPEFAQAVDWLVSEQVRVVNFSAGTFYGPSNGSGDYDRKVDEAASKGIIWVNAAGNSGSGHYSGAFKDYGNGWHEWRPGGRFFPIFAPQGWVTTVLTWDDWPVSNIDYDLFLFDSTGRIVSG